jgi:hypothetical protein
MKLPNTSKPGCLVQVSMVSLHTLGDTQAWPLPFPPLWVSSAVQVMRRAQEALPTLPLLLLNDFLHPSVLPGVSPAPNTPTRA